MSLVHFENKVSFDEKEYVIATIYQHYTNVHPNIERYRLYFDFASSATPIMDAKNPHDAINNHLHCIAQLKEHGPDLNKWTLTDIKEPYSESASFEIYGKSMLLSTEPFLLEDESISYSTHLYASDNAHLLVTYDDEETAKKGHFYFRQQVKQHGDKINLYVYPIKFQKQDEFPPEPESMFGDDNLDYTNFWS